MDREGEAGRGRMRSTEERGRFDSNPTPPRRHERSANTFPTFPSLGSHPSPSFSFSTRSLKRKINKAQISTPPPSHDRLQISVERKTRAERAPPAAASPAPPASPVIGKQGMTLRHRACALPLPDQVCRSLCLSPNRDWKAP